MKVLLLCNKVPYPARDGSTIAMASMIDAMLANKIAVKVLCFNTTKHFSTEEEIEANKPKKLNLTQVQLDNRVKWNTALRNLLSREAFHVSRFRTKAFRDQLIQELETVEYDIVQLEGLSMAVYLPEIRRYSQAKVVLRAHNVETKIWQRHLQAERNPLLKGYLHIQNKRLAKFERQATYDVDAIISITEEDLHEFWSLQPSKVAMSLPCGVDINHYPPCGITEKEFDLVYIASFDWMPNQQGIKWFLNKVWPLLLKDAPGTNFRLGGRHMPKQIIERSTDQLVVVPDVADMKDFMCSGKLVVVPLLAGSGMRIKILENMALGLCQVTTSIGAEGILIEDGVNIVIANEPEEMAEKISSLLKQPTLIESIGKKARQTAEEHYTNKALGKSLRAFFEYEVCK